MIDLVITKYEGLVKYLIEEGLAPPGVAVIQRANPSNIEGKHVLGTLPHSLSCYTDTYTEIQLNLPPALRGSEITAEQVRKYASAPTTYTITKV